MDRRALIFGVILLLLAPVLWPVAMLLPDRKTREARRLEREAECRKLIVVACEQGDIEEVRRLVERWRSIAPADWRANEVLAVLRSTTSVEDKLRHASWRAGDRDPWKPAAPEGPG